MDRMIKSRAKRMSRKSKSDLPVSQQIVNTRAGVNHARESSLGLYLSCWFNDLECNGGDDNAGWWIVWMDAEGKFAVQKSPPGRRDKTSFVLQHDREYKDMVVCCNFGDVKLITC
jgi:hypothetical protein